MGCFDEGVDDEDDGLLGGLAASFLGFLSTKSGESGPFSTAGETGSWQLKDYQVTDLLSLQVSFENYIKSKAQLS